MPFFRASTYASSAGSEARPDVAYLIWGEHCFAEFNPGERQPWTVQKYGQDWYFCLDRKADVEELMRRIDAYEDRQRAGGAPVRREGREQNELPEASR